MSPCPCSTLGIGTTRNALVILIKLGANGHLYNAKVDRLRFFYIEDGQGCHCPSSCLKPTSPASENRAAGEWGPMLRLRSTQAPALPGGGRRQTHGDRRDGQQPIRRQRPTRRPGTANQETAPGDFQQPIRRRSAHSNCGPGESRARGVGAVLEGPLAGRLRRARYRCRGGRAAALAQGPRARSPVAAKRSARKEGGAQAAVLRGPGGRAPGPLAHSLTA